MTHDRKRRCPATIWYTCLHDGDAHAPCGEQRLRAFEGPAAAKADAPSPDSFVRRSIHELGSTGELPAEWTPGSAFDILGWSPDGPVQATYQVQVLRDSTDFIAHGWIDADGDGVPAHFTITRSSQPVRVTPASVH